MNSDNLDTILKEKEAEWLSVAQIGIPISNIPSGGIKIEQPGTYFFTNNITWAPGPGDNGIAIDILCDDVTLNLNGYKLIAVPPNNTKDIIGINIGGENSRNITIQNGELLNTSLHGISAALVYNLNIMNITVEGSEYTYLGEDALVTPSGITVELSKYVYITNCTVKGANVTAPAYAGIQLFASTNANVANCYAENLTNNDGSVTGFSYADCQQIITINCKSYRLQSHYLGNTTTMGHTVLGFLPTGCSNLYYENCASTSLRGCCDDCHGMSIFDSNDIKVVGFRARGIIDGYTPRNTGAKATGLEVYGNNIHISYSVVQDIFAIVPQDKQSCGFSAAGNNITFDSCIAQNVIVFDEHRNGTNNYSKYGYGMGFGWAPDPREPFVKMYAQSTVYLNCGASYCQVGFDTWNHIDGKWENWKAENCNINILQQPGDTRIFSMDKCSELPPNMPSPMTIYNHAANNTFHPGV